MNRLSAPSWAVTTKLKKVLPIAAPVRAQLIATLRNAILRGEIAPGERLVEASLCEAMNVSRTSLREALRQLEAERLVTIVPYRGPVVTAIRVDEAEQIYEMRALLEGFAARRFAQLRTNEELSEMARALKGYESADQEADAFRRLACSDTFHAIFVQGSGNPVLADLLASLTGRVNYLRYRSMASPARAKQAFVEIRNMYEAFSHGNPDMAEQATLLHVEHARQSAIAALESENTSS